MRIGSVRGLSAAVARSRVLRRPCAATCLFALALLTAACGGRHEGAGEVTRKALPPAVTANRAESQAHAVHQLVRRPTADTRPTKQILFGDLHVHTTFSIDAFALGLPMMQGEGAHPPADACDFARFCSSLDFWSINDHAESITPEHWAETKESLRQCNAVSGRPESPDTVAFLGWEWSQVGLTPADHYGHKNVIFRDLAEDRVPRRPIAAPPQLLRPFEQRRSLWQRLSIPLFDFANRQRYFDFGRYQEELRDVPLCPRGVDTRSLPATCHEVAETPGELYEKLSQWGFDTIVIPHGTTWGLYTPPGSTLDKQLTATQHDPGKQTLFEVYSGHGNSEEYRAWAAVTHDASGAPQCSEATDDYEPCCWRAGEIIRARCGDIPEAECARRVAVARQRYVEAGVSGYLTVPGATLADWKDCGQCRDCFNPAFNFRPGGAAQYALALTNFDDPAHPLRFRFGFIGSSDNHKARPGTGYKEYARLAMTEATGPRDRSWRERLAGADPAVAAEAVSVDAANVQAIRLYEGERQASFFMTGGLVALHADRRDREAIWDALERREVYGTSGDRMLLWFDLLNGPDGTQPMGSEVALARNPTFRVRAIGALEQLPGCPDYAVNALTPARLAQLCRGECFNPGDRRRLITRIEVVRIRPQVRAGEPVDQLIEDPWRRFDCPPDPAGCAVEFEDPDFVAGGREVIYYVRAIQEPTPAVNAGGLRCRYHERGQCVEVHPCYGDYRTPATDDCLTPNEERAWSSPIYVKP